ncbi:MscS family protein [Seminavis robusta]|uniref:MscS family protein n=1 Tax=Seminavis robusta TaxID=568900 RepID=A0A9N8H7Q6_9STRA|nr:MscS family protein [Seminavis robusta]|eukprot:Sro147_g067810.1 MscS family protein (407) ;mRNA; r:44919-46139
MLYTTLWLCLPNLLLLATALCSIPHPTNAFLPTPTATTSSSIWKQTARNHDKLMTTCHAAPIPDQQLLTELAIAGTLGVVTDPLVDKIFHTKPQLDEDANVETTFLYGAANTISNAARVYAILILLAWFGQTFQLSWIPENLAAVTPKLTVTIWAAYALGVVKRTLFFQKVAGNKLGRVKLYDQLIDFVIITVTVANILDELGMDIGMGFQSVFAASGIGALIFSLASKDLAEQIVGGVILQAWDFAEEGDDVRLGDGTEGTIRKIGLVETEIAGYDNIVIKLPNSQIINQRVSNISRTKQSQVKQILRFDYTDIEKVPQLLQDIKEEIQASCPKLITDGSKPFAAVMSNYQDDHIQCVVNVHFQIQPSSQEYSDNKEEVLRAIARAVANNDMKFAIPAINYVNQD